MGSDFRSRLIRSISNLFQSTLPHGERPEYRYFPSMITGISIHAPAWGATQRLRPSCKKRSISIHAPAWGATAYHGEGVCADLYFNPRSRMGSDYITNLNRSVSRYFNPRSRMGSDDCVCAFACSVIAFQSTLPHGERPGFSPVTP